MTYQHVLAAVDLDGGGTSVVRAARRFIDDPVHQLTVLTLVEPVAQFFSGIDVAREPGFEAQIERAARQEAENLCRAAHVPTRCVRVGIGTPAKFIPEFANRNEVDLIAVGVHDRSGMDYFLGTTATSVLQLAHCDVLGVRGTSESMRYRRIVVAIDGRGDSLHILSCARRLAGDAEVHVILVIKPLLAGLGIEPDDLGTEWPWQDLGNELEQKLVSRTQSLVEDAGLDKVEVTALHGTPSTQIKRVVERLGADLIVMGSGEHVGVGWMIGSTTNNVLHGSVCDILVVRKHHGHG